MQHIEDAGIHSGDSACVLPPYLIGETDLQAMREQTVALAKALGVVGLINVQYAIKDGVVYVLEVNPRASRTIPFVSKAIGVPLASLAARVMLGETLDEIGFTEEIIPPYVSVKEAVFPFNKFPGTDPVLGPEMRSTGECMGISDSFGSAFAKAQLAASNGLPLEGVGADHGHRLGQADGHADRAALPRDGLQDHGDGGHGGVPARARHSGAARPQGARGTAELPRHDRQSTKSQLLINTPMGKHAQLDDYLLRQAAIVNRVSYTTTMSAASAACDAILSLRSRQPTRALAPGMAERPRGDAPTVDRRRAGMSDDAFVHESAYVDDGATIGAGTKIWHFCHVMPGAVIGERCSLGQNVVVMNGTRMGSNCKIQNNVSIYEGVELEDDVFCGPSMVFTNVINPRSHVSRKNEYRAHAGEARRVDRRERDDRLRRDARRVRVHRRRRGRSRKTC